MPTGGKTFLTVKSVGGVSLDRRTLSFPLEDRLLIWRGFDRVYLSQEGLKLSTLSVIFRKGVSKGSHKIQIIDSQ